MTYQPRSTQSGTPTIPPGPLTKNEHISLLKKAIAANLAARIEHDIRREEERDPNAPVRLVAVPITELMNADSNRLHLEDVIDDPIWMALRRQLKDLGQRLFDVLGTTNGMVEIAEEIADLDPRRYGYRINIIDKAWDGVGKGNDRWWS